ncbi:hypothetical protein BX611_2987 [Lutibacter oceani]|uniref:Uncharacterized protein n=1 Tax=Lutibacter oceani TaxID=1853311 RepID=A0A3D9RPM3_9FLAO|nr:hypothetical protein [Lutibacter oceani]REE78850.1 hypothetical protein BX611_2987 [Lutibacter oceani]
MKRRIFLSIIYLILSCKNNNHPHKIEPSINTENLVAILDTIWKTEQEPTRLRDSIGTALGFESDAFKKQNDIYHKNHEINEKKVL